MTPNCAQAVTQSKADEAFSSASANRRFIVVADSHVMPGTHRAAHFFKMLQCLEKSRFDVVFLGDIMELWIGLRSFEDDTQRRFLEWCRKEKSRRRIIFIEGNHEFFVVANHSDCFSASGTDEVRDGKLMLAHGDAQIAEPSHRRFRCLTKGGFAHFFLKWFPFAKAFVRRLKARMERMSLARNHRFPGEKLAAWFKEMSHSSSEEAILLGHFHQRFIIRKKDGRLFAVLPAWKDREEVAIYNPLDNSIVFCNWRAVK